jgi:hypothetical protein
MNIKNPTIVTALFDIGRDTWDSYNLSYGSYLHWMRSLLMYDNQMVIFTDEKLLDEIKKNRLFADSKFEKTIFVVSDVSEIMSYKLYHDRIKKIMESPDFQTKKQFNVPEMTKPLYNVVIFNKIFYINECIQKNYFNSDFYVWMDAGVLRDDIYEVVSDWPNLEKINNKYSDKITFFSHEEQIPYIEPYLHLVSQYRFIHGGSFFVPNNGCITDFIKDFTDLIEKYLNEGYVGSEEKYYDFCYLKKPNNYNLVKSDWRQYFNIFS